MNTEPTPTLAAVAAVAPCSARDWTPAKGERFELDRIEGGHVFAWQVVPSVQSQYLLCVICRKPHHVIFPPNNQDMP